MKKETRKTLSVIVIAKNAEALIGDCLQSVKWADEIIVCDSGSTDRTPEIAREHGAKLVKTSTKSVDFRRWRNDALKASRGDWVFYLDSDERIPDGLKEEIAGEINSSSEVVAYAIPRRNFLLGKEMHYGGWWPDYVIRLLKKDSHSGWRNDLHEEPVFKGKLAYLKEPLIHLTHRDLSSMIDKTNRWSNKEADLLFQANHPPIIWWRFLRIMGTEAWDRGIKKQGWRDGTVGFIEIIFQTFSRFITYAKLWEKQQNK